MNNICKKRFQSFIFIFIFIFAGFAHAQENIEDDTVKTISFSGVVINNDNGDPVVFANIFVEGTSLGTVTNTDGEFLIKIPEKHLDKRLGISSVGFDVKMIPIQELSRKEMKIRLTVNPFSIEEVIVKNPDPIELIRDVKINAPMNYGKEPYMMTGFYREAIKKN